MKTFVLFLLAGAGLYAFGGVDLEATLGINPAVTDTVLLVLAVLFVVAFVVRLLWTAMYIGSGQYALDRRLDQWIK